MRRDKQPCPQHDAVVGAELDISSFEHFDILKWFIETLAAWHARSQPAQGSDAHIIVSPGYTIG
jgi:hypothetical protein